VLRTIDARTLTGAKTLDALRASLSAEQGMVAGGAAEAEAGVRRILADVHARGDTAVCDYARQFDKVDVAPADLRVPEEKIEAAYKSMSREFIQTVTRIRDSVKRFQRHAMHRGRKPLVREGRTLRLMYRPLARVGVYVPGGKAFYPSTVLMTAVPALAAGVPEVAVASPPSAGGDIHPSILATCRVAGISEVYRMGGVQAIAAFAYGTQTVRPVEKIVGPGNAYVQTAKRLVFGRVDIDSFAGPSEVIVLADDSADPRMVAADMLSQAEHDPGSAILVTPSDALAGAVAAEVERQVAGLERADATRAALKKYSAIVLVADMVAAIETVNAFAPEHLEIQVAATEETLQGIRCAGAVFLGRYTPVAVGDYTAGPSHTLPTGGTAHWASGLTANDFLRSMSVVEYTREALAADAPDILRMAETEGLTAHAASVKKRLES
jgi:histidinol dehydrogenase